MDVLEKLRANEKIIASMGVRIREEAHQVGATFSYIEASEPGRMVIEHPDGSREYKLLSETDSKVQAHR